MVPVLFTLHTLIGFLLPEIFTEFTVVSCRLSDVLLDLCFILDGGFDTLLSPSSLLPLSVKSQDSVTCGVPRYLRSKRALKVACLELIHIRVFSFLHTQT